MESKSTFTPKYTHVLCIFPGEKKNRKCCKNHLTLRKVNSEVNGERTGADEVKTHRYVSVVNHVLQVLVFSIAVEEFGGIVFLVAPQHKVLHHLRHCHRLQGHARPIHYLIQNRHISCTKVSSVA